MFGAYAGRAGWHEGSRQGFGRYHGDPQPACARNRVPWLRSVTVAATGCSRCSPPRFSHSAARGAAEHILLIDALTGMAALGRGYTGAEMIARTRRIHGGFATRCLYCGDRAVHPGGVAACC